MEIQRVTSVTNEIVDAISALLPQLADSISIPSRDYLENMIASESMTLFVAKKEDKIIGMLSLVTYLIPSGKKAWIEDVVTDVNSRGKGVAKKLIEYTFDFARKQGIVKIDLTSNNQRIAAHELYEKTGFKKRDTSVFRRTLD